MIDVSGIIELQERTTRASAYLVRKAEAKIKKSERIAGVIGWLALGVAVNVVLMMMIRGF